MTKTRFFAKRSLEVAERTSSPYGYGCVGAHAAVTCPPQHRVAGYQVDLDYGWTAIAETDTGGDEGFARWSIRTPDGLQVFVAVAREVAWPNRFSSFTDNQDELDQFCGICLQSEEAKTPQHRQRVIEALKQLTDAVNLRRDDLDRIRM